MEHQIIINSSGKFYSLSSYRKNKFNFINWTSSTRQALATAMAASIRKNLDYQGISRRLFVVDQLPQEVNTSYDKDVDHSKKSNK